jgi:murein L,D-transpeptidase YcbB/YkuD
MYRQSVRHSQARKKLAAGVSVAALGLIMTLSTAGLVRSQTSGSAAASPFLAGQPAPQAQPQPTPAGLRDDQVKLLWGALQEAESHGFRRNAFAQAQIAELLRDGDPRGEQLLLREAVAYARAQHGQRIAAGDFLSDWAVQPAAYDAAADFNFALTQNKLAEWVANQPPPFQRYRDLRTALGQYRAIAARGGWEAIDDGPALKPGARGERVIQLRRRLAAENPPGSIDVTSPVYDQALAAVVAAAQVRYGLPGDGVVGADTLKAFNMPVQGRIEQIAANMERWRWMPRAWPATRVEVNIAAQRLRVYDQNKPVTEMKVVVGAPDKKTPMLQSAIHSVVLNPPWNVPKSIAAKEILPKGQGYMRSKGFVWVSNGAGGSRLQQRPGPGNSLGRIKFDFNNDFGVYLHDTNAKAAFGRDSRSLSHGCVRVERPEELANLLLSTDPTWTQARMDEVLADTETVRARLAEKIPVMLLYWTVFIDQDGQVNFRDDLYGWDDQLTKLLNKGGMIAETSGKSYG